MCHSMSGSQAHVIRLFHCDHTFTAARQCNLQMPGLSTIIKLEMYVVVKAIWSVLASAHQYGGNYIMTMLKKIEALLKP